MREKGAQTLVQRLRPPLRKWRARLAQDQWRMGSLYRSQHELLPLFKKGAAAHVNNVELGKKGRWRSNLWTYLQDALMDLTAAATSRSHATLVAISATTNTTSTRRPSGPWRAVSDVMTCGGPSSW
jgi:hypothetical protein